MVITRSNNNVKFKLIGYKDNAGEYNGKTYHNYIIYCAQNITDKGKGVETFELSLPLELAVNPADLLNKVCYAEFNYYRDAKRQKVTLIKVVE